MAAPLFTFISLEQAEVTVNLGTGGGGASCYYGNNGYDAGCPGFGVWGGTDYSAHVDIDISSDSLAEGWLRFRCVFDRYDALQNSVIFAGATTDLLRLRNVNAYFTDPNFRFEYWNGSTWVQIGSDIPSMQNVDIDIHWKIDGSTGVFAFYKNGVLQYSVSGDTLHTADTTIDTIRFYGSDNNALYETNFYHIFVDNVDSRGLYMAVDGATIAGTYTTFVGGGVAQVNERPGETNWTIDYITGNAVGQKFTATNTTIDSALEAAGTIESVWIGFGGAATAEPSFYAKPLMRIGSTDYNPAGSVQPKSEVASQLDPTYRAFYAVEVPLNPSTGAAWANVAAVEAAQFGWEVSATP